MSNTTTNKRSLLDISDDMQALDELLAELGGDVTDEQVEQHVDQWLAELDADLHGKVDAYCALIQQRTLTSAMRKEEAERLLKRSKADADAATFLKNKLKMVMEQRHLKKAGNVRTATVCGNGGKLPMEIDPSRHPETVEPRFQRVKLEVDGKTFARLVKAFPKANIVGHIEIDTDAVREAIEGGEAVGFARLAERGTHLRVK